MWNLPGPGIKLVSPALAGGFLSHCIAREVPASCSPLLLFTRWLYTQSVFKDLIFLTYRPDHLHCLDVWKEDITNSQVFMGGTKISIWRFILIPKFNSGLQPSLPQIFLPLLSCNQCLCPHRPLWKPAAKLIPGWHPRARKKKRWIELQTLSNTHILTISSVLSKIMLIF